jgi:hypothetical protein
MAAYTMLMQEQYKGELSQLLKTKVRRASHNCQGHPISPVFDRTLYTLSHCLSQLPHQHACLQNETAIGKSHILAGYPDKRQISADKQHFAGFSAE